jgi:hypothetical protein
VEHEVGVALNGVAEGWVTVERKVALPPPPRRAVRGIRLLHQVSSPLLGAPPSLSLPPLISVRVHCARCRVRWHADNGALLELTEDVQIWKAMSKYVVALVSSGGSGGSSLKRDGGGARRWQGVCGGRGDEAPLLQLCDGRDDEAPLLDGGLRRSGNSVYLDGRRRAGPDLGPTCPDLGSDFFYF